MLSNLKADLCGDMYRALPCLMWTLGALALRPESPVGTAWSWPLVTGTEEETPFLPMVFCTAGTTGFSRGCTDLGARPLPGHMTPRKPVHLRVLFYKTVLAILT